MRDLLLCGPMGAGKSTVAAELAKSGYHKIALAEPFKAIVREVLGLPTGSRADTLTREAWQETAEHFRRFDPTCWCRLAIRKKCCLPVVIEDGRQPHEVEFFQKRGFAVVYLQCPQVVREERVMARDGLTRGEVRKRFDHPTEDAAFKLVGLAGVTVVDSNRPLGQVVEDVWRAVR